MIPAVGYLRRSTRKQEQSLEGQREAIEKFAAEHGYGISRWYTDDGISGATGEARPEFLRMLQDAENHRDFQAVICYDMSRFGRMDGDETGHYRYVLRQSGVRVLFSNEHDGGDDETGEIVRPVLQAQKRAFLRQLSRDTSRGMIQSVQAGWITGRAAAYGLDRMLVDENGRHRRRLKRGEKESKPRNWHVTLVPTDDAAELQMLRAIFDDYANREIGLASIAASLNKRGIPSPHGGPWGSSTIRSIIRNSVYKGEIVFGRKSEGRFHRIIGGEVRPVPPNESKVTRRPVEDCVVQHRPEIALIPTELWERANQKLTARYDKRVAARASPRAYALSGLIKCGDCGAPMFGTARVDKAGRTRLYACSSRCRNRQCHCNTVREERLLHIITRTIVDQLFCGGDIERLKEAILRRMKERCDTMRVSQLKQDLTSAKGDLDRAAKNLLLADPANVPALNEAMSGLRERVAALTDELAAAERQADCAVAAETIGDRARELIAEFGTSKPEKLKAIFGEIIERVELRFKPATWGRRRIREVAGCDLLLRDSLTTDGRGDWRKFEPAVRPYGAAFNDPLPGHLRRAQGMVVA